MPIVFAFQTSDEDKQNDVTCQTNSSVLSVDSNSEALTTAYDVPATDDVYSEAEIICKDNNGFLPYRHAKATVTVYFYNDSNIANLRTLVSMEEFLKNSTDLQR